MIDYRLIMLLGLFVVFFLLAVFFAWLLFLFLRALKAGIYIPTYRIVSMKTKGIPVGFLIRAHEKLAKSGLKMDIKPLEACYTANRDRIDIKDLKGFVDLVHESYGNKS